jgi:hypothetical protein
LKPTNKAAINCTCAFAKQFKRQFKTEVAQVNLIITKPNDASEMNMLQMLVTTNSITAIKNLYAQASNHI